MDNLHRHIVAGVSVNATHASAILTVNRDKKRGISLAIISKGSKYGSDIMAS